MKESFLSNGQSVDKEQLKYDLYYYISSLTQENGMTDGVLNIENPIFLDYLQHNHKSILIEQQMLRNQENIKSAKADVDQINRASEIIITRKHELAQIEEDIINRTYDLKQEKDKEFKLGQKKSVQSPKNSLFVAIMFLLVGFIFIAADLLLTKEILVEAMNFKPNTVEAWLLALAIAGLAFALKPLVDYMFEKTEKDGRRHKTNLLYITSGLLLISLLFLGVYRTQFIYYTSLMDNKQGQLISKQTELDFMGDDTTAEEIAAVNEAINQLTNEIAALSGYLYNHWALIASIALLSLLFAVVGAICFSVSFPDLRIFVFKGSLNRNIKNSKKEVKGIVDELKVLQKERVEKRAEQEFAEEKIKLMERDINTTYTHLQTLTQKESDLLLAYSEAITAADKAWYEVCKWRGIRYQSEDNYGLPHRQSPKQIKHIVDKTLKPDSASNKNGKIDNGVIKPIEEDEVPYLHEYLRNRVGHNFSSNGNKVKSSTNGTQD